LTQKLIAELFGTTKQNISLHLQNIFKDKELNQDSVVKDFLTTAIDWSANFSGLHPIQRDINITKNYLNENELGLLNRIVGAYLSFAEIQAKSEHSMTMKAWVGKLNEYLTLLGKGVLNNAGKVRAEDAEKKSDWKYEEYKKEKDKNYISDFDKEIKKLLDSLKKL
jgi:hypothetical protein